jgi:hypothetical protein
MSIISMAIILTTELMVLMVSFPYVSSADVTLSVGAL